MSAVESVRWSADRTAVDIIDQRLLPGTLMRRELRTAEEVCEAIRTLAIRGAPAIGIAGAMGLVVATRPRADLDRDAHLAEVRQAAETIRATRPTAVNLPWALARMVRVAEGTQGDAEAIHRRLFD